MSEQSNDPPRPEEIDDPDLEAALDEAERDDGDDAGVVMARMAAMVQAPGKTVA